MKACNMQQLPVSGHGHRLQLIQQGTHVKLMCCRQMWSLLSLVLHIAATCILVSWWMDINVVKSLWASKLLHATLPVPEAWPQHSIIGGKQSQPDWSLTRPQQQHQ